MEKSKDCKLFYYTLLKKYWKEKETDETILDPLFETVEIFEFCNRIKKIDKFNNIGNNKFCFLEKAGVDKTDHNIIIISGFFKSARYEYRPDLINRKTGNERKNPKDIQEGDIEKTHFVVNINKELNEVYLILEDNYQGISIKNFIDYLKFINKKRLLSLNLKQNSTIIFSEIVRDDFMEELNKLEKTKIAEVFFDKKLLGSNALKFSSRYASLKHEIKLVATASVASSITEFAIDVFNNMGPKSGISKVRIHGVDENKNNIIIDTSNIRKVDFVKVNLNTETGDIMTNEMLTELISLAKKI